MTHPLRLYFATPPNLPIQTLILLLGNLGSLGSNKEIPPQMGWVVTWATWVTVKKYSLGNNMMIVVLLMN